jgi:hypothetical protein
MISTLQMTITACWYPRLNDPHRLSAHQPNAQPVHKMGKVAMERLIARLKVDKSPTLEIRLKTKSILRDSVGQFNYSPLLKKRL